LFASSETLNTATVKERKEKELDRKQNLLCDAEIISFQQDVHGSMY